MAVKSAIKRYQANVRAEQEGSLLYQERANSVQDANLVELYRRLSVLGLIGYATLLGASVLDMLGLIDLVAGPGLVWLVPRGLFELLLPIWLFARGINLTASYKSRLVRVSG